MKRLYLVLAGSCLLLFGCDSAERPVAENLTAAEASVPVRNNERPMTTAGRPSRPEAIVIPSPLTSSDTAQVMVKGCSGEVHIIWTVNGIAVENGGLARLAATHLSRGDEVGVSITCEGQVAESAVEVANSPPRVTRVDFANPVLSSGEDLEIVPQAFDQDGDEVSFEYRWWVGGELLTWEDGPVLPGKHVHRDKDIKVSVIPHDPFAVGPVYQGLTFQPDNGRPRFVTAPPSDFRSSEYSYAAEAVDPDGDQVVYRLAKGPAGMTVDSETGFVNWQIPPGTDGEVMINLIAEDPDGAYAQQKYTLNLSLED